MAELDPLETRLRRMAADTVDWNGETMKHWDQIRQQVETLKGSDLPRMNFESLIEGFADLMVEAAGEIERLKAQ